VLLLEWMSRVDAKNEGAGYYSNRTYNLGEGAGDYAEIRARRTWRQIEFWSSAVQLTGRSTDQAPVRALVFGPPTILSISGSSNREQKWIRNEYLYFGRTTNGYVTVHNISLHGYGSEYFKLSRGEKEETIGPNQYLRVKVTFSHPVIHNVTENQGAPLFGKLDIKAYILFSNNATGTERIELVSH